MSTTVRPGQVWQDNDKRAYGRKLRVVDVDATHATVELVDPRHWQNRSRSIGDDDPRRAQPGRQTRIRLDRFRPTSTGYRLIEDAPGGPDVTVTLNDDQLAALRQLLDLVHYAALAQSWRDLLPPVLFFEGADA